MGNFGERHRGISASAIRTSTTAIPPLGPPAQIAYLFLQSLSPIVPAAFLTFSSAPVYDAYARLPKPAGLDVVTDQQIAGVAMKMGGVLLWVVIAFIFFRWASREEAEMGTGVGGRTPPRQQADVRAPSP